MSATTADRHPQMFHVLAHHRDRTRRAEARAQGLERELDKAVRLLGLTVRVAAGQECDPVVLLQMLEEIDEVLQHPSPEPTIDELAQLLRETDPGRSRK